MKVPLASPCSGMTPNVGSRIPQVEDDPQSMTPALPWVHLLHPLLWEWVDVSRFGSGWSCRREQWGESGQVLALSPGTG